MLMLSTNPYDHVIALEFTKASDTARHSTLTKKVSKLNIQESTTGKIVG